MIKNLPLNFPISALASMDFGDVEARDDHLLNMCPIPTGAISEFLNNRRDIVIGYRGAGKSAIVRLLEEKKLSFKEDEGYKPIIVCLDEEFDYQAIRDRMVKNAVDERTRLLSCRLVWEILLIYRALQKVREFINDSDSTIRECIQDIDVVLGINEKKPKLLEVILSHKKKIGIKLDSNMPHIVDMYAGIEPSLEAKSNDNEVSVVKLMEYKRYLNKYLNDNRITLYVLFDRLDDFVFLEDYETQKKLLQGLLSAQTDYRQKYHRIKVKTFLRTDIFNKLDLNEFGPDKILARCVELKWTSSELRHFLAKRVAHNILKVLGLNELEIKIDSDKFFVNREELQTLTDTKYELEITSIFTKRFWSRAYWLAKVRAREKMHSADGRVQNSLDVMHDEIITSIFPREVLHYNVDGRTLDIDIFKFIDTHLQFSHGQVSPRLLLSFVNKCLQREREYYYQNKDIHEIKINSNGEYPVFVKKAILQAYADIKKEVWVVQYQWAKNWELYMSVLERMSGSRSFSFQDYINESHQQVDEAKRFMAFVTHTGLIKCLNEKDKIEKRKYEFPLLYMKRSKSR